MLIGSEFHIKEVPNHRWMTTLELNSEELIRILLRAKKPSLQLYNLLLNVASL